MRDVPRPSHKTVVWIFSPWHHCLISSDNKHLNTSYIQSNMLYSSLRFSVLNFQWSSIQDVVNRGLLVTMTIDFFLTTDLIKHKEIIHFQVTLWGPQINTHVKNHKRKTLAVTTGNSLPSQSHLYTHRHKCTQHTPLRCSVHLLDTVIITFASP